MPPRLRSAPEHSEAADELPIAQSEGPPRKKNKKGKSGRKGASKEASIPEQYPQNGAHDAPPSRPPTLPASQDPRQTPRGPPPLNPQPATPQATRPPLAPIETQAQLAQRQTQGAPTAGSLTQSYHQEEEHAPVRDPKDEQIRELQAQVAALTAAQQNSPPTNAGGITALKKPEGEAGAGEKGFVLRTAMGLGSKENKAQYKAIQNSVRRNIYRYDLDPMVTFHKQPPQKLALILQAGRQQHSYLCTARFPNDWAQLEFIKTITRNRRKYLRRLAGMAEDSSDGENHGPSDGLQNFDNLETIDA
ncbi:hypothetical protein HDZ31DRAFT_66561 [Schizophyllum fasciatum]